MTGGSTTTWIGQVELATSLTPSAVSREACDSDAVARLLVRLHGRPLGFVTVPIEDGTVGARALGDAVHAQLARSLAAHLEADGLPFTSRVPVGGLGAWEACADAFAADIPMSVVVCTRNQPGRLERCVGALRRLHYRRFEAIVVDNAPNDDSTRICFDRLAGSDPRFRYAFEPVPGLSRARNVGLQLASSPYVAFTDDDVEVDGLWLDAVATAFLRHPEAGCVTGLVPAASLDDPAAEYFERRYTWAAGMHRRVFDLGANGDASPLYPYSPGIFGTGANFAVDRDLVVSLGGFDEALGAGTPPGGGEDLDAFVRILQAGRTIVYEPAAIGWHEHRSGARALRRQLFFYGAGLTGFLTKHLAQRSTRRQVLGRIGPGILRLRRTWSPARIGGRAPALHVVSELAGMGAGPIAYLRGRRRTRRLDRVGSRTTARRKAALAPR